MLVYIKSNEDISGFIEAGKYAADVLSEIIINIREGTTTEDLNQIAIKKCKKFNPAFLNHEGFPGAICASVNNTLVHGVPNQIPLQKNDLVSIDFGSEYNGYIGDTATTVCVNGKSNMVESCKIALGKGIEKAVAGNKLSDISEAIFDIISDSGYNYPEQYGGHGIDRYSLHGNPFVSNYPLLDYDMFLYPGMIIAIEPMFIDHDINLTSVSQDGWSVVACGKTAHEEHTVLITDNEPLILTRRANG